MKCPKCGGKHVYVSKTLYPEDYVDTDNGTVVDFECVKCGYKSDQETEWTEDAL
jgi:predicted RNA-binding Zn-ribbon protein involved in translation (DUF1610 family)